MKRNTLGRIVYSASDLVRYFASPYASWMDHYYLENPTLITPDAATEEEELVAATGITHELELLSELKSTNPALVEILTSDGADAIEATRAAIASQAPIIYQAALVDGQFAGFADFLTLETSGDYQVWDTKLARSPRPYYAIQLCCYSEMLAAMTGQDLPDRIGLILGTKDRVEFRLADFIHYYRRVRSRFLAMHNTFTGSLEERPEPLPRADHGRWTSYAEQYFDETDHLIRVAGISIGQIKKLKAAGVSTLTDLSRASGIQVPKLAKETHTRLVAQASLQWHTRNDRAVSPDAPPRFELLTTASENGAALGLAALPTVHPADVFFDIEGYPLAPGGLEYLFGACTRTCTDATFDFRDWWAHDREEEKLLLENFVDWVYERWKKNPGMHIYHYAAYEVSAVRRLSTRHDTRQDEVDDMLRSGVFVDLYQVVRHGLRVGEDSYSIKRIERLYRPKRISEVASAVDSIVQYARWIESKQSTDWHESTILKAIRDYNEDDCCSTAELLSWLCEVAGNSYTKTESEAFDGDEVPIREINSDVAARQELAIRLRDQGDRIAIFLADLVDFHRREEKPMWWRMFDRAEAAPEDLRDDHGCIEGVEATGVAVPDKQSLVQSYSWDPNQELKLSAGATVMFTHNLGATLTLTELDPLSRTLALRIGVKSLEAKFAGHFPSRGSLILYDHVPAKQIQSALASVSEGHLHGNLPPQISAFINRIPPTTSFSGDEESTVDSAIRIASSMAGGCLVIQGPPGTGKTYTASQVIHALLTQGKLIGISSNSHKAVVNLLSACGDIARSNGHSLIGLKVGGDAEDGLFVDNPNIKYADSTSARKTFSTGVVGGTAWLFTRPEWEQVLDFLFIDEAGQVSLANAVAMARCAKNLVLLGDQMQLEQPIQGSHPGVAGLSALQYALIDESRSIPDRPVFHSVVPSNSGLFLGQSRRMHPAICEFISESVYEGKLTSHPDCATQKISINCSRDAHILISSGIAFSPVEHDGNVQQSEEEVERVRAIYEELAGREYTDKDGSTKPLDLSDFLFISPYNAQVRKLLEALPAGARVGTVDRFQGQEAAVCILSLCSSAGDYGSRGLGFILDRNRINVAISRAKCLAVVVADPRIADTVASSIDEMRLLNRYCKVTGPSLDQ